MDVFTVRNSISVGDPLLIGRTYMRKVIHYIRDSQYTRNPKLNIRTWGVKR